MTFEYGSYLFVYVIFHWHRITMNYFVRFGFNHGLNEGDLSPLEFKRKIKMYFSIVSLICVFCAFWCFPCSVLDSLLLARSVAATHRHGLSRPAVPKPFLLQHNLSRLKNKQKKTTRYTVVNVPSYPPLETAPCSLRGPSTSVWEPLL